MSCHNRAILSLMYFVILCNSIICDEPTGGTDGEIIRDEENLAGYTEDIPYEKRVSGHSFVRFGKRGEGGKGHKLMYFGKRSSPEERHFVELLQYLQKNPEPSWKRGHSIMRFGKRAQEKHNFIRFGKRDVPDGEYSEEDKRGGHSMMYFGKRNGHSMLYFGKRQADEGDNNPDIEDYDDVQKKAAHSMMYFGKRMLPEDEVEKKGGHSMMYFGKRFFPEEEMEKKTGHSMMYFGKREPNEVDDRPNKHAMLYFGKRDPFNNENANDEQKNNTDDKRASHSIIRFGKRQISSWLPSGGYETLGNRYYAPVALNNNRGFGRSTPIDKKKHNMMHFGKRSIDTDYEDHDEDVKPKQN